MFTNPTAAVARALQAAQEWARQRGAEAVQPEHLLYGLLAEDEGRAATLLARAGTDVTAVRRALVDWPTTPAAAAAGANAATNAVSAHARELAAEASGERTVASEQLLAAIVREDPALRKMLEFHGLERARLEDQLRGTQAPVLCPDEPLDLDHPAEEIGTARVLDASANRAREALRVLEDYSRFVLDDTFLTGEWKRLRHGLAEALRALPPGLLLAARETRRDVGTRISTASERERTSPPAVAAANVKRLQEALRSLEEFGKLHSAALGQAVERLRYESYTLERAVRLGETARERLADARLYVLLSAAGCSAALDWTIREAAAGGARVFQLREKGLADRALLERARQVRRWTREAGALFILNDRPDIARLADADGVHVGQDELPVKEARQVMGPDALIGVSTHSLEQLHQAVLDGASYVGVGPTFPSETKAFGEFPGLDFVRQAAAETSLPAFVIGGVTPANVDAVVAAGGRRVAVSQAVCRADDPARAAAELLRALTPEQ